MTDAAYIAKNWLMRTDDLEEQRIKQINKVMLIESKVNNCVSHYETSGRRDLISAQAAREDLLADYATERAKLEAITEKVLHEDLITIKVLDRLKITLHAVILFERHVNRHSIRTMVKSGMYEIKEKRLYDHYNLALQELAEILEQNNPPEIIPNKNPNAEQITIINAAPA